MSRKLFICAAVFICAAGTISAGTINSLYGDQDCFGLPGVSSCPDGSDWETGLGGTFFTDYRDSGEVSANSFTDIWASPASPSWLQPAYSRSGQTALSASLAMRIAGIADGVRGPWTVSFDGTSVGTIPTNPASDGFQEVLTYTFVVPVGLLTGSDTVSINTDSGDGYIIDYSDLSIQTPSSVPEPGTFGLLLAAGIAMSLLRRHLPRFN
jgi:hypothetical protein